MRDVLLLCGFLIAADQGHTAMGQNLFGDFLGNINHMTQQILQNADELVAQTNQQFAENLENDKKSVAPISTGIGSRRITNGDGSVIVTEGDGSVTIINADGTMTKNYAGGNSFNSQSGYDANGMPYHSTNQVNDGILTHTDRVYNYNTNLFEEHRYRLDLNDLNAKPENF